MDGALGLAKIEKVPSYEVFGALGLEKIEGAPDHTLLSENNRSSGRCNGSRRAFGRNESAKSLGW